MGYFKEGLKALNRSIELNPVFADAQYSRAKALFALEKFTDSAESLKTALQLNPELRSKFETEFKGIEAIKEFESLVQQ
jgi:tetratricopeptide (TPR) repeat protein